VLWDEKQDVLYVVLAYRALLRKEMLQMIAAARKRGDVGKPKQGDVVTIESEEGSPHEAVFLRQTHQRALTENRPTLARGFRL
jgi:hypothetical protein